MFRGVAVAGFSAWRASSEAADHALWTMQRPHARSDHLRKEVNVVISFTRHLFANRVQHFQEFWATIHKDIFDFRLPIADCRLPISTASCEPPTVFSIGNRKSTIKNQVTLSVASDTKNSGVTIIGT